ncbi:RNA polymerase sigma factor [Hathewaya proteolytica]|nr:sigma-70 family RNA polymerase sigma factor [Hathewaya proteolytica]
MLVMRARSKDKEAFVKLMELNMQSMYKVAKAYLKNDEDVADAIQDTILICYEKIGDLKKCKYFKTWMIRILINKCKDSLNLGKKIYFTDEILEVPVQEMDFDRMEFVELLKIVDEKYRTILLLYYLEGFNTREISEILELNEKTVQTRLSRGRDLFSKKYMMEMKGVGCR